MTLQFLAALMLLAAAVRAEEPARLDGIEVESSRVVLKLSRPAAFRIKVVEDPPGLRITFSNTDLAGGVKDISSSSGMARGVSPALAVEGGVPAVIVALRLDSKRDYEPVWSGGALVIELKGPPPAPEEPAPEAAAPPAPAPPAPAARKRSFRVQLASLPSEKSALRLKARLEPQLNPLEVRKAEVNGKTVYRVSMGPYPDRAAAAAALKSAAAQGQAGIITRE